MAIAKKTSTRKTAARKAPTSKAPAKKAAPRKTPAKKAPAAKKTNVAAKTRAPKRKVWEYIKKNDLQDKAKRPMINADVKQ